MQKHHPKNERIKREFRFWLQDTQHKAAHSIDQSMAAIALFELSTNYKDFATFRIEQAQKFKRDQLEAVNPETMKTLAKATVKARLDAVKAFFLWLADQKGYDAKIKKTNCEYFNMSANDARIATAKRERPAPELAQVHFVLDDMRHKTPIEKRDRAIIAFTLLTGARDDAIASMSLGHVDMLARKVFQDARDVRTKNRKTFYTWFFPVGGQAETIVRDWVLYLNTKCHFGPGDPLFPQTKTGFDDKGDNPAAWLKREHWKNADAIRLVFKRAFSEAGLPSFNPHSIRNTLVRFGERICQTPEEFKAWSQNLGHEQVLTTFNSYGNVASHRQAEILVNLKQRSEMQVDDDLVLSPAIIQKVLHHLAATAK